MEFTISKAEMNRRKKAYLTMVTFMVAVLFLFFELFGLPMTPLVWVPFVTAFLLLGVISFSSLHKLARLKITISEQEMICVNGSTTKRYLLKEIQSIRIKRRSTGGIRDISLLLEKHKHVSINGFEEVFEPLRDSIMSKVDPTISIIEFREPMDFDHPLFYPVFGTLMSFCYVVVIKVAVSLY